MTSRMAALRQPFMPLLFTFLLGATGALASGCQLDADAACQRENGVSGEAYLACVESFESANAYADAEAAEAACERHWEDCRSRLSSHAQAFNPFNSCRDEISGFAEKDSDTWSDQANRAKNLFMGCKAGARAYFDMLKKTSPPDCQPDAELACWKQKQTSHDAYAACVKSFKAIAKAISSSYVRENEAEAACQKTENDADRLAGCKAGAKGYFEQIATKQHLECLQAYPGYPLAY
jgi:hypothetical protein